MAEDPALQHALCCLSARGAGTDSDASCDFCLPNHFCWQTLIAKIGPRRGWPVLRAKKKQELMALWRSCRCPVSRTELRISSAIFGMQKKAIRRVFNPRKHTICRIWLLRHFDASSTRLKFHVLTRHLGFRLRKNGKAAERPCFEPYPMGHDKSNPTQNDTGRRCWCGTRECCSVKHRSPWARSTVALA